jgi:hypothetical protein
LLYVLEEEGVGEAEEVVVNEVRKDRGKSVLL